MIELNFLGPARVLVDGQSITARLDKKELSLLAYLAAQRDEVTREKVAALLWGEKNDQRAKHNLRQALTKIKQLLPGAIDGHGHHVLALGQAVRPRTDLWRFEDYMRRGDLTRGCALYRGPLLDGLGLRSADAFEDWLSESRRYYERLVLDGLTTLLGAAEQRHDVATQEHYARQMLTIDPLKERAYRALLMALGRAGRFDEALQEYARCVRLLGRELGIAPSAETTAVYERVLSARGAHRPELPFHPATFVGRERELTEATARLMDPACRLLTLLGPGGVGKTRLGIELARRNRNRFLHDIAYLSLETWQKTPSEDDLLVEIAKSLGLRASGRSVHDEMLAYLQSRELLLVLDNFELFTPVSGALRAILREAPGVKIIVTSRRRLDLADETIHPVAGLGVPPRPATSIGAITEVANDYIAFDAPTLFVSVAQRLNPNFHPVDVDAIIRICQLVEGLPLALELVAPWTLTLSAAAIAERLAEEGGAFVGFERNFANRQRSLYAVFEHSYRQLTLAEQRVFRRLAVVLDTISPAAAKAIAGATLPILESLMHQSMLETPAEGKAAMHNLLRAFALEKLKSAGELSETRALHYAYFQKYVADVLLRLTGGDLAHAQQQLADELSNLLAAWRFGSEHAAEDTLSVFLDGLVRLFDYRTWYAVGTEILGEVAEHLQRRGMDGLLGRLMLHAGLMHYSLGNFDEARRLAQQGGRLVETVADEWGIALAHRLEGSILYDDNHYDEPKHL